MDTLYALKSAGQTQEKPSHQEASQTAEAPGGAAFGEQLDALGTEPGDGGGQTAEGPRIADTSGKPALVDITGALWATSAAGGVPPVAAMSDAAPAGPAAPVAPSAGLASETSGLVPAVQAANVPPAARVDLPAAGMDPARIVQSGHTAAGTGGVTPEAGTAAAPISAEAGSASVLRAVPDAAMPAVAAAGARPGPAVGVAGPNVQAAAVPGAPNNQTASSARSSTRPETAHTARAATVTPGTADTVARAAAASTGGGRRDESAPVAGSGQQAKTAAAIPATTPGSAAAAQPVTGAATVPAARLQPIGAPAEPDRASQIDEGGILLSDRTELGPGEARSGTVPSAAGSDRAVTAAQGGVLARAVAQQMGDALAADPSRPVEIHLEPRELGRVRMVMTMSDHGVTLHIAADRPETLDLMRRNIDTLAQDFTSLGYRDLQFAFAGSGGGGDGRASGGGAGADPGVAPATPNETAPQSRPILLDGRLDIRI